MKKIDFLFVGQVKNPPFKNLEADYHTRIKRYIDSQIVYLKDSSEKNVEIKKKKESELLINGIKPGDYIVICDETGKSLDTKKFSQKINEWQVSQQRIVFVIGGAYGMTEDFLKKGKFNLRLSDFTLPHELARVVLLEQVYRSMTILRGEKYHH